MAKWEYLRLVVNHTKITPKHDLNDYGADGWELVSALQPIAHETIYVFKRQLVEAKAKAA